MEERILIVTPRGRDAQVVEHVLSGEGMECVVCADVASMVESLQHGAACALIADDALDQRALHRVDEWLNAQPPWSDFPFVLLGGHGKKGALTAEGRRLQVLGNVMLIERPMSGEALVSAARGALRARRRQYQARAMIAERATANARLLSAARQKDEFLAMLAHELRNPLAPIRNAVEVIRMADDALPPRVQWARQMIERQSRHLAELLEDLLDVSRITTGKVTLKCVPIELAAVLTAAVDAAMPSIEARRHSLTMMLPHEALYVHADPTRMTQVFGNLLDNAAKYTPDGGKIEIRAALRSGNVVVSVKDNGTGISPEELHEVFELFSQSNRALDRAQGGLGIGLSVVRSLVDMHGGAVDAHSEGLGLGTQMTVMLPVTRAPSVSDPPPSIAPPAPRDLRVLVVDDNRDAADSLAILLEMTGYHARTAMDGPTALEQCKQEAPDVVLLDIGLPGMDGYEVARRLKRMPPLSRTILIATTGYGQSDDVARSKSAGFDYHLVKPVEPENLIALFEALRDDGRIPMI